MHKLHQHRLLPVLSTLAAFLCVTLIVHAQVQVQPLESASILLPPQPLAASQVQPTPEQIGDTLMVHKRYQAAIEAYKNGPHNSAAVWNKMGIAYQMMFDQESAIRCYLKSLKIDPHNANVLNNLGTVYDAMKQDGQAERMYRKALKIEPNSALIRKNLGTALLTRHKYKKGWELYRSALAIDPHIFDESFGPKVQNPGSLQDRGAMNYYMAKGCAQAGMTSCAIEYLRLAINEGFTNPKKLAADSEFAGLRGVPAFEQLMAEQKNQ